MSLSEQFWLSVFVEFVAAIAMGAMMKQQLKDLVGWVREINTDMKILRDGHTNHEGRIAHVEGRLGIPRE